MFAVGGLDSHHYNEVVPKVIGICIYIAIALCIIATVVCIALIGKYYVDNIKNDNYYSPYFKNAPRCSPSAVLTAIITMRLFMFVSFFADE